MANETCCATFLRNPEKFFAAKLPTKMPPTDDKISPEQLLVMSKYMAYMEQTVSEMIKKAMSMVGKKRIKYPGLSVTETALLNLALQLKATNPNQPEVITSKYREKLGAFLQDCDLIQKLGQHYEAGGSDSDPSMAKECARFDDLIKVTTSSPTGFDLASHMTQYYR